MNAQELKRIFDCYGQFVRLSIGHETLECRPVLELIARERVPKNPDDISKLGPDLLVVMMNPGSSKPLDPGFSPPLVTYTPKAILAAPMVPTRPDTTQYQIMRVMVAMGFRHARIFNLSDLRETKSPVFVARFQRLDAQPGGRIHSLFCPERGVERNHRMGGDVSVPVLAGWGRHPGLIPLAQRCLESLAGWRILGVEIPENPLLYAHPSPMLQRAKEGWMNAILEKFTPPPDRVLGPSA